MLRRRNMMGSKRGEESFVKPDGEVVLLSGNKGFLYTDIYPVLDGVTVRLYSTYTTNWLGIIKYDENMNQISDTRWHSKTTISPSDCTYFQLYGAQNNSSEYKIYALWS